MKVKNVTVSRSVKINRGNYESTDMFVALTGEAEPGEEIDGKDVQRLVRACEMSLLIDLRRLYRRTSEKLSDKEIAARHGLSYILENGTNAG